MKSHPSPIITNLLSYARLSPSVHNTQPWLFSVDELTVSLHVNKTRILAAGDPTHRELWISLGVCLETLLFAAEGLGYQAVITHHQTDSLDRPVATVTINPSESDKQQIILDAITQRHSYRGRMQSVTLPDSLLADCKRAISDLYGVSVSLVTDKQSIETVAAITNKGMRLALSNLAFRSELAQLINYNWSPARVGMHGFVLNRGSVGSVWEKWSIKFGMNIRKKALADQAKILESSGLLFIATEGDVPSYWLTAGRAYARVCYVITQTNLAQSTVAAPIEAASFHEDVEHMIGTPHRIQAMIRVGKAAHPVKKTSPRLHVDELLT